MASSLGFSAKHKHANSPACMRSLMETMNSLVFRRQSSCAQLSQLVHFHQALLCTWGRNPLLIQTSVWMLTGGRISLFQITATVLNTEWKQVLLTSKQFFAVNSTDWKPKCRNSTDLWRPTVPWWLRSLSALPSPTLLCISTLQPGTHSLAGTDRVTITWTSLVFPSQINHRCLFLWACFFKVV